MTNSVSRRFNLLCIEFQIIDNNTAHPVICDGCYLTHMRDQFEWPHCFTESGGLGPYNHLNPTTF